MTDQQQIEAILERLKACQWFGSELSVWGEGVVERENLAELRHLYWQIADDVLTTDDFPEDVADFEGRVTAADWHGGQSSPLYAYASTGTVVAGLVREITSNIDQADDDALRMLLAEIATGG